MASADVSKVEATDNRVWVALRRTPGGSPIVAAWDPADNKLMKRGDGTPAYARFGWAEEDRYVVYGPGALGLREYVFQYVKTVVWFGRRVIVGVLIGESSSRALAAVAASH